MLFTSTVLMIVLSSCMLCTTLTCANNNKCCGFLTMLFLLISFAASVIVGIWALLPVEVLTISRSLIECKDIFPKDKCPIDMDYGKFSVVALSFAVTAAWLFLMIKCACPVLSCYNKDMEVAE